MEKRLVSDAEGLVWKEVEKGKQFIRAIGEWFGISRGGMSDDILRSLAEKCQVIIKEDDMGIEHENKEGGVATHSVREVVMA